MQKDLPLQQLLQASVALGTRAVLPATSESAAHLGLFLCLPRLLALARREELEVPARRAAFLREQEKIKHLLGKALELSMAGDASERAIAIAFVESAQLWLGSLEKMIESDVSFETAEKFSATPARKGAVGNDNGPLKARVSPYEAMKKREEKKKKREEKKILFDDLDSLRRGASSSGPVDGAFQENLVLVDQILQVSQKHRLGSLPWAAKVLGLPVTAEGARARAQAKARMREVHPDVCSHPQAHEAFDVVQKAWNVFQAQMSADSGAKE
jgi:hypothetical protein